MTNPELSVFLNSILEKHGVPIKLGDHMHLYIDEEIGLVKWHRSKLDKLLPDDLISNYLNQNLFKSITKTPIVFSHYLSDRKYLKEILETGHLRFYNLSKYVKNNQDEKEYRYLIDLSYPNWPQYEKQIGELQNSAFIFCLTNLQNSDMHLKKYCSDGNGAQVLVKINYLKNAPHIIQLKRVVYEIPFLEEIFFELKAKYGLTLDLQSIVSHAPFVKKSDLSWESEFRLCINTATLDVNKAIMSYYKHEDPDNLKSEPLLQVKTDEFNNNYILLPLKNHLFEIEITEV